MITAILIATGRLDRLNESVASFLTQNYSGECELIIANTCVRQTLKFNDKRVKILNIKMQALPMRAKAIALEQANGDTIVMWSELDYYLPDFLSSVEAGISDVDWCFFENEFLLSGKNPTHSKATELSFAFKKKLLDGVQFKAGINGASDRNFIAEATAKFEGRRLNQDSQHTYVVRIGTLEERERVKPTIRSGLIELTPFARNDYSVLNEGGDFSGRQDGVCVVELGRYGDIINILPFLQMIAERHGPPHLMVSQEFATLLEGVSYVKPFITTLKNEELGQALEIARRSFKIVINAQIWGKGWQQQRLTKAYNVESWRNCGILHLFDNNDLLPLFDKRDLERERKLVDSVKKDGRPMLLVNVSAAISSPCEHCKILLEEISSVWGSDYQIIDLSTVRAERLYDFLTLFNESAMLVCIDTAFLHLAASTSIPIVPITNSKEWAGTVVRGNGAMPAIGYNQVKDNPKSIHEAIAQGFACGGKEMPKLELIERVKAGRIFHCVERHEERDQATLNRKLPAWESWDVLYRSRKLIPAHYWKYRRTADKEVGDTRPLPFLKDLFEFAMNQMRNNDILMWTNDDNPIHPEVADYIRFHVSVYGVCTSFRSEFNSRMPSFSMPPHQFDLGSAKHMGRDIFAATKFWLMEKWNEIPDFIIGCSDFDLCLAALVRNQYGIETTNRNISELMFPAEIQRGYVAHLYHQSHWSRPGYENTAPGQKHNRRLFREWAAMYCPALVFNESDTLK